MNKKSSIAYLILMLSPFFFSCRGPVKKETKTNESANPVSLHPGDEKYIAIDTKETVVEWRGYMQIGSNSHSGFVSLSKGELLVENDQLLGGVAEINMNTIQDETHRSDNNLIDHLKDPDFFDVKKFPTSTITFTKVGPQNGENIITGNLTIKGITQPVTFPAMVEIKNGIVRANARLVIDRTKWNVRYKSGKFYDLLADQTMSDSIEFNIKIVAKSK